MGMPSTDQGTVGVSEASRYDGSRRAWVTAEADIDTRQINVQQLRAVEVILNLETLILG